jgi:WD repeat-containing protein 48
MPSTSRRVSYVLSPPAAPVPFLELPPLDTPRNGHPQPLLRPRNKEDSGVPSNLALSRTVSPTEPSAASPNGASDNHPRHCLGVAAIALDTTTQLYGKAGPEGILYTGGRDGLVAAWEVGIKFKPRSKPRWSRDASSVGYGGSHHRRVNWERLEDGAGWDEDDIYATDQGTSDDGGSTTDGDDGDDSAHFIGGGDDETSRWGRQERPYHRRRKGNEGICYEQSWEVDVDALEEAPVCVSSRCHSSCRLLLKMIC